MIARTLNVNFIDIVGISMEPLAHLRNMKNNNSQIKRGRTVGSYMWLLDCKQLDMCDVTIMSYEVNHIA